MLRRADRPLVPLTWRTSALGLTAKQARGSGCDDPQLVSHGTCTCRASTNQRSLGGAVLLRGSHSTHGGFTSHVHVHLSGSLVCSSIHVALEGYNEGVNVVTAKNAL